MKKRYTFWIDDALLAQLQELHADTYKAHRLAFGPWLVGQLADLVAKPRRK